MKLSAPDVMPVGLPATLIWLIVPEVVMTATLLVPGSVTHRLPSGPETIRDGADLAGRVNWVTAPPGVTRATWWLVVSVTHRLPSGPVVIRTGPLPAPRLAIEVTVCGVPTLIRATLFVLKPTT